MNAEFADSNVLIYLASGSAWKEEISRAILDRRPVISVQVLNEIANVLVNKLATPWDDVSAFLASVRSQCEIVPLDEKTHDAGIRIAMRHRLHIYDSMILAAALLAGCDTLYSEDMHAGLVIENRLRIVNPFAAA
jgi:predicted nucleic acid-binding protein